MDCIQRYDANNPLNPRAAPGIMYPSPHGDWVRFKDFEALEEKVRQYRNLAVTATHEFPQPCGLCNGTLESSDDREWHGLGNCVEICSLCNGSGINPPQPEPEDKPCRPS